MRFFRRLFRIFNPPAAQPQKPLKEIDQEYKKHRRIIFSGTFARYGVLDWAPTYLSEVKGFFDYKGQG